MDQMKNITTYEYKEITVRNDKASLYLDCYESFGWKQDENFPPLESGDEVTLKLKRDRRLLNKVELTRPVSCSASCWRFRLLRPGSRTLFCLPHPPGQKDPAGKSVY